MRARHAHYAPFLFAQAVDLEVPKKRSKCMRENDTTTQLALSNATRRGDLFNQRSRSRLTDCSGRELSYEEM